MPLAHAQGAPGAVFNGTIMNNTGTLVGNPAPAHDNVGGFGAVLIGNEGHVNSGTLQGGNGGAAGGHSGSGVKLEGGGTELTNTTTGRIIGPNGGFEHNGGYGAYILGGDDPTKQAKLYNFGTIVGGNGGGGTSVASPGIHGFNAYVSNAGVITGGLFPNGTRREAVLFGTGRNTLELQPGGVINGNVLAFSRNDTLALGGTVDNRTGTFNVAEIGDAAKYRGFGIFQVVGTDWTLTGTTAALTPWRIFDGSLTVSSDGALGASSGGLTLLGSSTLRVAGDAFTSTARQITVNDAGAIDIVSPTNTFTISQAVTGTGSVAKRGPGTLVYTGNNTYAAGTTIETGTLQLGNGGTTGSVVGNIVNNASLVVERSNAITLGGVISGSGTLTQTGTGTTTLTGANSYTGATEILAGTLLVNGNQRAATGTVTTTRGTTVGGSGVIGGDVVIADGATLSPGASAGAPGTLTIAGDLSLSAGSALAYQFGQAGTVGGSLNDLTVVEGDLVLDGILNATASPGGTFGGGLYRVISYSGSLTDNGLDLGTSLDPDVFNVQTSVANQVNLINATGLSLNFWDGDAGGRNDGTISGGDGTWQARTPRGSDNWTDRDGAINALYADGAFAIFAGTGGTVNVDNSVSAVTASGLQFATDGYRVAGDALTLIDDGTGSATLRVGDGTTAGADYTATLDTVLQGDTAVTKTDAGTLVLGADNTYTDGTTIAGGTLQLGHGGTTGSVLGDIVNNATLAVDRSGTATLGNLVSGSGQVHQIGDGTTVMTADNTYTGGTTISSGTLQLGAGGTTGSLVGDVVNNATLEIRRSDALTLAGTISGSGHVLQTGFGTTTLTGDNTYTGGTAVSNGTLRLGDGGTSGSVVGDVVVGGLAGDLLFDAELVFDRSDVHTFAGAISGRGRIVQAGTGTTVLTGANAYTGATDVAAGTLLVNGDQRAATGATSVASGATIGGAGVIGGDVAVASGATLAPGASTGAPGTLTIAGDLSLADGAVLDYQFGQAGTVGGPLNDLTVVEGDLVLDGTLNATQSPGGEFGTGLYRVISYGGALTNNTLDLGTMLDPAQISVQTSIANQVNLVNATGLTLNFWDGDAGGRNDGTISGGDGTWQARAGNDNWTDADGTLNAPHSSGAFAIFAGAAGAVDVDNSLGDVVAGGMQFATDGYVVQGDALTLVADDANGATIRVGDGTTAGANFTATIDAVLQGDVGVVKTDAGTLVLGGANTYTGGTTIAGGTVAISEDGNLGAATGGLTFDGGTLRALADLDSDRAIASQAGGATVDTQAHAVTLGGAIDGPGALTKAGTGTLTLTADNGYTGGTTISSRTLQLGDGGTTGHIVGDIVNNGTLAVNRSDAVTLAGAMSGTGHLTQMGAGTTVLTGANTHTGGTTIAAGTLQVGDGGTSGSLAGDIVNNAALVMKRSDETTLTGVISGTGHLTQAGTGTTVLVGDNTYTGGTTISAGTLQVGNGGDTGSLIGNVDNGGTLAFDRAGTSRFDGTITGSGRVVQTGPGAVLFGNANTYTGVTEVASGSLQAAMANAFSANSRHEVAADGTLDLAGYDQTVAGLHNAGTVSLMGATPGTTLTVRGDYVGDGGVLQMSAALGDSSSPTDRLVIDGGTVSGRTLIDLTNRDGLGAQTTGDGIEVVRAINGATTTAQTTKDGFSLVGDFVDAGAFEYRLYAADAAGLGENWYLRSSNRGEAALFGSLGGQFRESAAGMLGNLHQRLGDATMGSRSESAGYRQSWGRLVSVDRSLKQGGDATPSSRGRQNGLQIGSDVWASSNWHVGAYFGTLAGEMEVAGSARGSTNLAVGRTDLDSKFVGLYGTFEAENGFYVDTVLQGGRLRYKLIPTIGDMVSGDGDSRVASVEIGQAFPIGRDWQLEPQLQLIYQRLDNDDVEIANALVQQDAANSLTARVGLRLKGEFETEAGLLQPYTRVNYYRTRSDQDVARFIGPSATADIVTPTGGRSSELAMGGTLSVNNEVSLFGEVGKLWAHGDQSRSRSDDLSASVGVKVGW
ncbi:autotransporter-associated beta strand repeat-containing protein [Luteimonas sp. RC10]|uniref:autotransporter-associated beta strand repeat-containing protein n=1 Tax=Luteimonas sp. RC10 TaxID=2587035 RepID=UPI0017944B56|nr:autotransporter-associated beta strand repeat-containing protein [Luteimonas sp. RC10]MBB3342160.1 outer membrane autotransporter protein [Luteimonas sp. RC10]